MGRSRPREFQSGDSAALSRPAGRPRASSRERATSRSGAKTSRGRPRCARPPAAACSACGDRGPGPRPPRRRCDSAWKYARSVARAGLPPSRRPRAARGRAGARTRPRGRRGGPGKQGDVRVADQGPLAALGDRQRCLGLAVAEPPAREPLTGLADGDEHPLGRISRSARIATSASSGSRPPSQQAQTGSSSRRTASRRRSSRPASSRIASARPLSPGHQAEVMGLEVVFELGVIDELTGEQALDALATPLRGAARPVARFAGVLDADRGEQAVAERRLRGEQATKGRARDLGPLRLFDQEVSEERRCRRNSGAGRCRGRRRRAHPDVPARSGPRERPGRGARRPRAP